MGKGRTPSDAQKLRNLAEECHGRAYEMNDKGLRDQWLKLAELYSKQAAIKERLQRINARSAS